MLLGGPDGGPQQGASSSVDTLDPAGLYMGSISRGLDPQQLSGSGSLQPHDDELDAIGRLIPNYPSGRVIMSSVDP